MLLSFHSQTLERILQDATCSNYWHIFNHQSARIWVLRSCSAIYPLTHRHHTSTDPTAAHSPYEHEPLYFFVFYCSFLSSDLRAWSRCCETTDHDEPAICAAFKPHLCTYSPHRLNSSTWELPEGLPASCFSFLSRIQWPHRSQGCFCLLVKNLMYEGFQTLVHTSSVFYWNS